MTSPANVPLPSTPDLERQPLLASGNSGNQSSTLPIHPHNGNGYSANGFGNGIGGGAQARSHIPEALSRRPSAHEQLQRQDAIRKCWRIGIAGIILALLGFVLMTIFELISGPYRHLQGSCDHVPPISPIEFEERQVNLSRLLVDLRADAYIAEPGTNMRYFSNIHWSQSERPFLLVVQAKRDKTDQVLTKITIVAPAFEASRARQSLIPGSSIAIQTWEEGESAYKVVRELLDTPWAGPDEEENELKDKKPRKEFNQIYVDADMRQFVSSGLATALESSTRKVTIAHRAIKELRAVKSPHEIDILRCVSTTSVNVIRAVKGQLHVGLFELEVQEMLTKAYRDAGLEYEAGG
ncbi:hypothetical protein BG000_007915, partial [Podila horticola]